MKKVKTTKRFADIPQDCLYIIYIFLDIKTFSTVYLSSKYFYNQIETPVFWRQASKSTDSFKKNYINCLKSKNQKVTGKLLKNLSKIGKQNRINNSPILKFVNKMCIKIASFGYDGILYNCSKEVDDITPDSLTIRGWKETIYPIMKETNYFDFFKVENIKNYGIDELEIFNVFQKEDFNSSVLIYEIKKRLFKKGIKFERMYSEQNRVKFSISW